jgi:hypothetical protein
MYSTLHDLMEKSDDPSFLAHWLPPLSPNGGFVTLNRVTEVLGATYNRFENAVKKSPRETVLEKLVEKLAPLLAQVAVDPETKEATFTDDSRQAIRSSLSCIQDENYSAYVRPTAQVLASEA